LEESHIRKRDSKQMEKEQFMQYMIQQAVAQAKLVLMD
jgi:hypothetical protein